MIAAVIFCWVVTVIVVFWLGMLFQAKNQPTDSVCLAGALYRRGVSRDLIAEAMVECAKQEKSER